MRKKNKQKQTRKNSNSPFPNTPSKTAETIDTSKRFTLAKLGWGTIGGVALLASGSWAVSGIQTCAAELDLSRLGNGVPTIVQIHDPNCSICMALQKEARAALGELDTDQIQYLVANIRTAYGRKFANTHSVGHITLLLFDGKGNLKNKLEGPRQRDELLTAFKVHLSNS